MATLKQISDQIAGVLDRPFDDMFKERVKATFLQELATYIRQQIMKHGIDNQFKTRYSITCIPVLESDNSIDPGGPTGRCFRSVNKVAKPVRYNSDDPFTYIGGIQGNNPYLYTPLAARDYAYLLPSINTNLDTEDGLYYPPLYDYRNGYIYVYFLPPVSWETVAITIEGVHTSYNFIQDESKESKAKGLVYNDDVDFPMPDDIIQLIKDKLLAGEFSIIDDKDKVKPSHIDNN